jgi:LPXTG-motif cell wall-anchored protein
MIRALLLRAAAAGAAVCALVSVAALPVHAALDPGESDTFEIRVQVPVATGGQNAPVPGGIQALPATGMEFDPTIVYVGAGFLVAGILLVLSRSRRPAAS